MRLHGTSKTKESKYNATVTLFISVGMLLVALMVFDFSEMPAFGKVFMIFWIGGVCAQIYQSYRNSAFSKKSLHHEVTDHELKVDGYKSAGAHKIKPEKDYALRLRKLENLYRDGLLTTTEYEAKRQDILDEDWGS
jgi:Short C-terminal domain